MRWGQTMFGGALSANVDEETTNGAEPIDPDLIALPVECPVPICAGSAASPENLTCTNTDPARPVWRHMPTDSVVTPVGYDFCDGICVNLRDLRAICDGEMESV